MSPRRTLQLLTVRALNGLCGWVDQVAYRPAILKLTEPLPRWWNCQLADASVKLDGRWRTGYWDSWGPGGPCDACHRRASWLEIGGRWQDEEEEWDEDEVPDYLDMHPVHVCFWCMPVFRASDRNDKAAVEHALREARRKSISWRWRYFPIE
jgi:hypothetical protein